MTFRGHKGLNFLRHSSCDISFPISRLLTRTVYLAPFPRYSSSKIKGHDLWPLWDTVGQSWYSVSKDNIQLCISHRLTRTLYLVSFPRYLRSKFRRTCRKTDIWPSQGQGLPLISRFTLSSGSPGHSGSNEVSLVEIGFAVWTVHTILRVKSWCLKFRLD